jgi:hypothetical protein
MELSTGRKAVLGFKFGLFVGVIAGIGHLIWFLFSEHYQQEEVRFTFLNLASNSINTFTFWTLLFTLALIVVWIFYQRLEGLSLAGLIAGLVAFPIAYFINKNYLPGLRETKSLIGNGLLAVVALAFAFFIFKKWTRDARFIHRFANTYTFVFTLLFLVAINGAFRLQPEHKRLEPAPSEPHKLMALFELKAIAPDDGGDEAAGALESFKYYFEKKFAVRQLELRKKLAQLDSAKIVAHADSILMRRFTFVGVSKTLPQKIQWRSNPTGDFVWLFNLNRQEWLWDLAAAYFLTGDEKYARDFETILSDWFEQNPMMKWKNESDLVWRLIDSSLRITASWLDALTVFFPSDAISDSLKWKMLASIHDHAQFLLHFRSPGRNHLLQETYGLMAVAAAFPEFKMANAWLSTANFRLERVLRTEIYPDGGYNEGSTFYHRFVIRILQQIADFAAENDVKLSDYFYQRLQEMYTFLMYLSWPDGTMPQINDGFHAKNLRILYEKPAQMFNRDDLAFFASEGKSGKAPAQCSVGLPYSGLYVMRSDWSERARYLIVDAGLFGSSHGHEDKLSFELFAFGKPFIIESGTFTYAYNRWHHFFESSFSHNTVVVDNKSQLRYPYENRWVNDPPQPLPNIWISNERLDYLEAKYDEGYGNNKENILKGVTHTRRILFVKPDYWILWDVVNGDGSHLAAQLFHFPAEPKVNILNERDVYVDYPDGPGLTIKTLRPDGVVAEKTVGADEPIQGWISLEYGTKVAAPAVSCTNRGELPQTFVSVLYPIEQAEKFQSVPAERLPVQLNGSGVEDFQAVAIKLQTPVSTDYVLIAPAMTGEKRFEEVESSAELLLLRKFSDGREVREEVDKLALDSEK